MKISLKWLNDFVDVSDYFEKTQELADLLTRAGLEVEDIQDKAKQFNFVVTGLILEKDKHPNADKLSLCKVTTGEGVVHQIVCGAQNHKKDDKVIVALPGAVLPGNFMIKQAQVRGVDSGGMLCSYKELGMAETSDGIAILPTEAPLGKPLAQYLGLDDVTFDLKVTPNRADCLSHYGLAREVACLLGRPLREIKPEPVLSAQSTRAKIQLEVKVPDLCPRYTGRYIQGIKVGPSPAWLKSRLEMVGLNSINNVVDCTNYVMMEMGQPLHAFDAATIGGNKVIVDRANKGEAFVTLDGTELKLTGEELMIKDTTHGMCIAGVIGGKNSGVSEQTQNVFLEAAYFSPMSARKSSRTHGLNTDSGYRFSRGVDPNGTLRALDRATELLLKVAGGEAFSDAHDVYPNPVKKAPVQIKVQTVSDRMGYPADAAKFEDYMKRLGCGVEKVAEGEFKILPPSYRFDLEIEMDLVEEYGRLNGYEHIPEALPVLESAPTPVDLTYSLNTRTSFGLRSLGFSQAMNYALVSSANEAAFLGNLKALEACGFTTSEKAVRLVNPLGEDMDVLRRSLVFGLYKNVLTNFHYGNEFGRLFEIGKVFESHAGGEYREGWRLGLAAWGVSENVWDKQSQRPLVYTVKGQIESLLSQFGITAYQWQKHTEAALSPAFLHRGQNSVLVVEGKKVGFIGTAHPSLLLNDKIRVPVVVAEIDLDLLYKGQPRSFKVESISKFPRVQRDLALVMNKTVIAGDVIREIRKEAGPLLSHVGVFDLYEGDKLQPGQKSVAFRLTYQDKNATLQDQAVNDSIQKILAVLKDKFAISVR